MFTTASRSHHANALADFHFLPEDVILRILLFCDTETLFACKRVSRPLHVLINADIYLRYKTELALDGMVDGPASCTMTIAEKLQLLQDYSARYYGGKFSKSGFSYSWQRWPHIETMPTTYWQQLLGFGGSIAYIVIKPPQKEISICAPPHFTGPREMRGWVVPYEAISKRPDLVVISVSVDLSQDLLLVGIQGEDPQYLSVLIRSLDSPEEVHLCSLQPTLGVTVSDELGHAGGDTQTSPGSVWSPFRSTRTLWRGSCPRNSLILATLKYGTGGSVNDSGSVTFTIKPLGQNVNNDSPKHSHYISDASFTLLDDAHIVTATGPPCQELVVQSFAQKAGGQQTGPVLTLGLPPQHGSIRTQESSIPSPPSPSQPFWTDPALRMVVVKATEESALLIPYKTFRKEISAVLPTRHAPGRKDPPRLAWEDWKSQTIPLVPTATESSSLGEQWSFEHCHSYGSRVIVNAHEQLAVMFDLNPWAAHNARRFPKPALSGGEDKDPKDPFSTKDVTLPHGTILCDWFYGTGFAQSMPALATDPMGFTEVYSMSLESPRFLGSISHYV